MAVLFGAGCTGGAPGSGPAPRQVAYVGLQGDARVAVYDVDGTSGAWSLKQTVEAAAGGAGWATSAPMAVSPDRRRLHVGIRGAGTTATYAIAADGRLSLLGTTDIRGSAPFLSLDRTGRWLLAPYYPEGKVTVHRIDADGRIVAGPVQEFDTAVNAHSIMTDPSNRFVFVPHTGPNAIYQFRFDAQTGRLEPNNPPIVSPPDGTAPRHHRYHPRLDVVYFINEAHSSVSAFRFDPGSGTLTQIQNISTLPADRQQGGNSTADLHLTPDGRFLYGSNRGHNSIAAYSVDQTSGQLTLIDWFETEQTPRSFALDTTGQFLYVAGQGSGNVAAYRIDPATGRLARFATYEAGPAPTWIEVIALD